MSPTIFRHGSYRAFFFSREEPRLHVHMSCPEGEAKFWIEPVVDLAHASPGLARKQIREMQALVEKHAREIAQAWTRHFPPG